MQAAKRSSFKTEGWNLQAPEGFCALYALMACRLNLSVSKAGNARKILGAKAKALRDTLGERNVAERCEGLDEADVQALLDRLGLGVAIFKDASCELWTPTEGDGASFA